MKKQHTMSKVLSLEEARAILDKNEKEKIDAASKKLGDLIKAWEEETGCTIIPVGTFEGNQIKTGIKVIFK